MKHGAWVEISVKSFFPRIEKEIQELMPNISVFMIGYPLSLNRPSFAEFTAHMVISE